MIRECGHLDAFERITRWTRDGAPRIAVVCAACHSLSAQEQAIPCSGCGGFDPRPGWPGQFNAPTGYYGGGTAKAPGSETGHWFPWCVDCLEPLPVICSACMGGERAPGHVCGQPWALVGDAAERLWHRYLRLSLAYPSFGIELRHLLGERDWPGWSEVKAFDLPAATSLWASVEAATEAIRPFLESHLAREQQAAAVEAARPVQLPLL